MCSIGTSLKFATSHEQMPIGCDEFGYLNLTKTLGNDNVPERIYLPGLISEFKSNGITEAEYAWMITPHAYHVLPGTTKAINQYPPGTSMLLKIFPLEFRKVAFPFLVICLMLILPILYAGRLKNREWNYFDLAMPALLFLITVTPPFTTELARVNSLAVTFGLLISAGIVLKQRPLLSVFLIALTINFRIANAFMILPVLLYLPYKGFSPKAIKYNLLLTLKYVAVIVLAIFPLLIYNYLLLGNPFASTYSVIDTAVNKATGMFVNLNYYLSMGHYWLRLHLILTGSLAFLTFFNKVHGIDFLKAMCFVVLNYAFFSWHSVTMDYYPYASAIILGGILLGMLNEFPVKIKYNLLVPILGLLLAVTVFISGFNRYRKREHVTFEEATAAYSAVCKFDFVWCDLYSGTTEYACSNFGFRFTTGTLRSRKIALKYLNTNGYSQAVILKDVLLKQKEIESEVIGAGLAYSKIYDSRLGLLLIIPGKSN